MSEALVTPTISVKQFIEDNINERAEFDDDPFIVIDLSKVQERLDFWLDNFPDVELFFALKAQNHAQTVQFFVEKSCGFDVASLQELQSVLEAGCGPKKVVFAQPYKQPSHLKYALEHGILSVCDSVDEIEKVSAMAARFNIASSPEILIRILPMDSEGETVSLSTKFGAPLKRLPDLVEAARRGNITIVGISFHVGYHCHTARPYLETLKCSRDWWDKLENKYSFPLRILDIGGGFAAWESSVPHVRVMAREINSCLGEVYGDIRNRIRTIAEPGRFMANSSGSIVARVIAEKHYERGSPPEYVINAGAYGPLASSKVDLQGARNCVPYLIKERRHGNLGDRGPEVGLNDDQHGEKELEERRDVVLWGPTCDSYDRLIDGYCLDGVKRGDWIVFPELGAYCTSVMTRFNGFPHAKIHFVRSDKP